MNILICGFGNIGKHILEEFKAIAKDITVYDAYRWPYNIDDLLRIEYDYAFICVPTEMNIEDGSANISEVEKCISKIKADVIIVKSAVPVGTSELFASRGIHNIVISPEYYGTTQHSLLSPNFAILGGEKAYTLKAAQLYSIVKDGSFKFIFTDSKTAELAKYMENCWLATKVTFCNEFAAIAEQMGINYEELRECFIADERVNPSHTFVYKDKPYYDSHCLNKDIPALLHQCRISNASAPLMTAVDTINRSKKATRIADETAE